MQFPIALSVGQLVQSGQSHSPALFSVTQAQAVRAVHGEVNVVIQVRERLDFTAPSPHEAGQRVGVAVAVCLLVCDVDTRQTKQKLCLSLKI